MEDLYHYTDSNGLLGILQNNAIWLTNIQFLNDNREFEDGKKIIYQVITQKIEAIKVNPIPTPTGCVQGEINQDAIINYLSHLKLSLADSSHPGFDARNYQFVFSLSKKQNLLSQWRAYCPKGGYSLVFNSSKLKEFIDRHKEYITFEKCIYNDDEKATVANQVIEEAINTFVNFICTKVSENERTSSYYETQIEQPRKLILLATRFKHHSFYEEDEIRLISNGYNKEWLCHRVSKNIIVPYLKVPLNLETITEVMIGPNNGSTKATTSLSLFLFQSGLFNSIKVSESDSPLIQ